MFKLFLSCISEKIVEKADQNKESLVFWQDDQFLFFRNKKEYEVRSNLKNFTEVENSELYCVRYQVAQVGIQGIIKDDFSFCYFIGTLFLTTNFVGKDQRKLKKTPL